MSNGSRWARWIKSKPTDFAQWLIVSWIVAYIVFGLWVVAIRNRSINGFLPAGPTLLPEYLMTAVWIATIVLGIRYFRWRALWVLLGLPIAAFWPVIVAISETYCGGLLPCRPW